MDNKERDTSVSAYSGAGYSSSEWLFHHGFGVVVFQRVSSKIANF